MKLSHKELVKLGRYESSKGNSLNKIEADFARKGVDKKETLKALDEVDYYNKVEKSKKDAKKNEIKEAKQGAQSKNKSKLAPLIILIIAIMVVIYLFYSGLINFGWLQGINFK